MAKKTRFFFNHKEAAILFSFSSWWWWWWRRRWRRRRKRRRRRRRRRRKNHFINQQNPTGHTDWSVATFLFSHFFFPVYLTVQDTETVTVMEKERRGLPFQGGVREGVQVTESGEGCCGLAQ